MFAWPVGVSWCHWHLNGKYQADLRNPICCEASASTASSPFWSKRVHIVALNRRDDDINLIRDSNCGKYSLWPSCWPFIFTLKNVATWFQLSKKLTSCLFCNICVIFEWPWLSHILPCDGLTEFVLLQSTFFVYLLSFSFLTLSTIPLIMDWKFLVSAWSLNDSAEIEWETARPVLDAAQLELNLFPLFFSRFVFHISWFPQRNEGVKHSSAICEEILPFRPLCNCSALCWCARITAEKNLTGFLLSHYSG